MKEELRPMPRKVRSSLIDSSRIASAKGCYQQASMEHTQPRKLINTKTSQKGLSTFIFDDTPGAPSIGSTLHTEQGLDSLLHPLETVKVILKLEEVLHLKSITATDDLHKLL